MSGHEKEAAYHHGPSVAQLLVRDPTAYKRRHIDEQQVVREQRLCVVNRPRESLTGGVAHVEREHRDHSVEAEALPHLRGEKDVQPFWVAINSSLVGGRHSSYSSLS